jgi:hypothetical protein
MDHLNAGRDRLHWSGANVRNKGTARDANAANRQNVAMKKQAAGEADFPCGLFSRTWFTVLSDNQLLPGHNNTRCCLHNIK